MPEKSTNKYFSRDVVRRSKMSKSKRMKIRSCHEARSDAKPVELLKNSLHGAGTLILEGSLLRNICTNVPGDFNLVLSQLLIESAV